jgi:hypothetical protein
MQNSANTFFIKITITLQHNFIGHLNNCVTKIVLSIVAKVNRECTKLTIINIKIFEYWA